jgi:hypothetical protein
MLDRPLWCFMLQQSSQFMKSKAFTGPRLCLKRHTGTPLPRHVLTRLYDIVWQFSFKVALTCWGSKSPMLSQWFACLQEKDQKHCLEQFFVQNLQRKFRASWICKEKVKSVASGALFRPHPHRPPQKPHPPTPPTILVATNTSWRANLLSQVQNKWKPIMKIGLLAHIGTARSRENAVNTST